MGQYLAGLRDKIRIQVQNLQPATLDEALFIAEQWAGLDGGTSQGGRRVAMGEALEGTQLIEWDGGPSEDLQALPISSKGAVSFPVKFSDMAPFLSGIELAIQNPWIRMRIMDMLHGHTTRGGRGGRQGRTGRGGRGRGKQQGK